MRELLPRVFTLTPKGGMFSVALSVTLTGTFLLRSMVLCAVPTFLAPAFPARDSLPESRCKNRDFLETSPTKPLFPHIILQNLSLGKAHLTTQKQHLLPHPFVNLEPNLTIWIQLLFG